MIKNTQNYQSSLSWFSHIKRKDRKVWAASDHVYSQIQNFGPTWTVINSLSEK